MNWLKKYWLVIPSLLILVFIVAAISLKESRNTSAAPVAAVCSVDAGQLLNQINTERSKLGAPVLVIDPALATSSKQKLDEMATSSYFGHNRLDGSAWYTILDRAAVNSEASEDIEFGDLTSVGQWNAFKNSKTHYESITNPKYTRVGISTKCEDFTLAKVTGPADNSKLIGSHVTDLTVVHLAAPQIEAPQQSVQEQLRQNGTGFYPTTSTYVPSTPLLPQ